MKRLVTLTVAFGLLGTLMISTSLAQPPREQGGDRPEGSPERGGPERGPERGGPRGPGGFGGRGGFGGERGGPGPGGFGDRGGPEMFQRMMQALPLMAALDANKDGKISESEIANAARALKTVDKNGDGQLTMEELRPSPPAMGDRGGRGPGPGPGARGEGDRGGRGREMDRADSERRPGGGRGPGGRGDAAGGGPEMMLQMFARADRNKDGKLTGDEIPERLAGRLEMVDTDGDGSISKSEIEKVVTMMRERGGSAGRGRGGRGSEDRSGGDRPRRPVAEE